MAELLGYCEHAYKVHGNFLKVFGKCSSQITMTILEFSRSKIVIALLSRHFFETVIYDCHGKIVR